MANKKGTESPIVYSTSISNEIRNAYEIYSKKRAKYGRDDIEVRAMFHRFVSACEKENKNYLTVMDEL